MNRIEDVTQILSSREITFSTLARNTSLQENMECNARDIRFIQIDAILDLSKMTREHGSLQASLAAAMFLAELIEPCKLLGLDVKAIAQVEAANVLWDQGEMTASISMLKTLKGGATGLGQTLTTGNAELLAKLVSYLKQSQDDY